MHVLERGREMYLSQNDFHNYINVLLLGVFCVHESTVFNQISQEN